MIIIIERTANRSTYFHTSSVITQINVLHHCGGELHIVQPTRLEQRSLTFGGGRNKLHLSRPAYSGQCHTWAGHPSLYKKASRANYGEQANKQYPLWPLKSASTSRLLPWVSTLASLLIGFKL